VDLTDLCRQARVGIERVAGDGFEDSAFVVGIARRYGYGYGFALQWGLRATVSAL
jgi:hypothetical protein